MEKTLNIKPPKIKPQTVKPPKVKPRNTEVNVGKGSPQHSGACISEGCAAGAVCNDVEEECSQWATGGECEVNPVFMNKNCNASCGLCGGPSHRAPAPSRLANSLEGKCRDDSPNCAQWAGAGECENNAGFMFASCRE